MPQKRKKIEEINNFVCRIRNKFIGSTRDVLVFFNITPAQKMIMNIIEEKQPIRMKDVAEFLGTSNSAVTQIVGDLNRKGFILKKENKLDKRSSWMVISKKGEKILKKIREKEMEVIDKSFDSLNEKDMGTFLTLLRKIKS